MSSFFTKERPALFLGFASFLDSSDTPFPYGPVDIFQLSQHKLHIIYPGIIKDIGFVLVSTEFLKDADISKWELRIADENNIEFGKVNFASPSNADTTGTLTKANSQKIIFTFDQDSDFALIHFKFDGLLYRPGKYTVYSNYDGKACPIGSIHFHYRKAPALTPDQIKAIESSPDSAKAIRLIMGCKHCSTKLQAYTGLGRSPELEKEGCIWQTDLASEFVCECGRTKYSLEYLKESMHGMLLKDFSRDLSGLSYIRRYGHSQVVKFADEFIQHLDKQPLEQATQKFIEQHPLLLSRFHASRLFLKPNIVGRFQADFAIVDFRGTLWLIELEKPSLQLFKKDGHPTQALMHAYGQVNDWLYQYGKYPGVILDQLGLKPEEVVAVRGAVIAGRSRNVTHDVLRRHLSSPPYPNIEFMTCDDLSVSLIEISKKIA